MKIVQRLNLVFFRRCQGQYGIDQIQIGAHAYIIPHFLDAQVFFRLINRGFVIVESLFH